MRTYIFYYLILINIITFIVAGLDKRAAKKNTKRTRETTLFYLALIGGSVGLYMAMHFFRHKTKHKNFTQGVPVIIIVQIVAAYFMYSYFLNL